MDRSDAPTTSYGSRSQYEREKERLIVEINQCMDIVNRNLVQLNQNLESAISLGSNFSRVASLWSEFGTIINPPTEEDTGGVGGVGSNDEESMDEVEPHADDDSGPDYESESHMDEDS
ncbi:hypothetical protein GGI21_005734 [Coemansia aciculifera]|uniref:Uncharacterized protein n=1 Tax=Coemansia aciculifera TaxID=417176 RepID=A0ACC1LXE6_9FUNG|nr:hypothetical protein IWW38_004832 [Coemansia aciculifera]KAJ2891930.1 hypothetical protein GGI21_005734 [Coemansia aciculifera]